MNLVDNKIFLSYIVPCYNIQNYLPRCLASLSSQKNVGGMMVEFILVNDGSKDNTLSILRQFQTNESRAIIIDQHNQGVSAARNAGLKKAQGEYVFFLDGDDYLTDDASQIIYDVCKEDNPDIVIPNAYKIEDGLWEIKKEWNTCVGIEVGTYKTMEFAQQIRRLPISFKAYRREILIIHNILYDEDLKVGEVYAFFLRAMTFSHQIAFTDKRIMNYVERKSGVMRTINLDRDRSIISTIHRIDEYARNLMPALRRLPSYKRSLFSIVDAFGMQNYVKKSPYTREIGQLLKTINKDAIYIDVQKFVLRSDSKLNILTMYRIAQYYLPISCSYRLIRLVIKIRKFIKI